MRKIKFSSPKGYIRRFVKRYFPFFLVFHNFFMKIKFRNKNSENIFNSIFNSNSWEDCETISGQGSNEIQTSEIVRSFPSIVTKFRIRSVLDIPCGDFYWMKNVDLEEIEFYYGGDIVDALIIQNQQKYSNDKCSFHKMDITTDRLFQVDLIFTRDCFVHFSFKDIQKSLINIKTSKSHLFATTTFPKKKRNRNIQTGGWRPINLQESPFNFPEPVLLLNEKCTEGKSFEDKCIGIWYVSDIPDIKLQLRSCISNVQNLDKKHK
jgi:hypothetical protein